MRTRISYAHIDRVINARHAAAGMRLERAALSSETKAGRRTARRASAEYGSG